MASSVYFQPLNPTVRVVDRDGLPLDGTSTQTKVGEAAMLPLQQLSWVLDTLQNHPYAPSCKSLEVLCGTGLVVLYYSGAILGMVPVETVAIFAQEIPELAEQFEEACQEYNQQPKLTDRFSLLQGDLIPRAIALQKAVYALTDPLNELPLCQAEDLGQETILQSLSEATAPSTGEVIMRSYQHQSVLVELRIHDLNTICERPTGEGAKIPLLKVVGNYVKGNPISVPAPGSFAV